MPTLADILRTAVPVGAQVAGGLINRRTAGRAGRTMADAANAGVNRISQGSDAARRTMADVYGRNREILEPFRRTGESALPGLREGVAEDGEFNTPFNADTFDLYKDPGFNFRLEQGRKAIEAGANAGGIRFSGATLKALSNYNQDAASQEYGSAFNRYQDDTQGRFNRVSDVAGIGERAARDEVQAGSDYGQNLARLEQTTAAQIADLEQQAADAEASGDIAQANSINDMISGILGTVENVGTARSLANLARGAAPIVGSTSLAALAGGSVPAIAGTVGGVTPAAMGAGTYGLSALPGATTAGSVAGSGGLAGTLAAAAPFAIAGGALVGGALLWRKSQAHHEANQWVQGFQNPFDSEMAGIDRAVSAGQVAPEQATAAKQDKLVDYIAAAMNFARKGSDQAKVIGQAMRTLFEQYKVNPREFGYQGA